MFARALLLIGGLGVAAFVAAGILGFDAFGAERLRLHLFVGFGAVLLVLLSQVWILLFLMATTRALREAVASGGLDPYLVDASRRRLRLVAPWLGSSVVLTAGTFAIGPEVIAGVVTPWLHGLLSAAAVTAQIQALRVERRELRAHTHRLHQLVATVRP
jgi:hypothetical protein